MFRRTLYNNGNCRLTAGLLGGLRLERERGSFKVDRRVSTYLLDVLDQYKGLGGKVEPGDEGATYIFEQFVMAIWTNATSAHFREYFSQAPEAHAQAAMLESDAPR